jgi:lipopolysaccharide biosynthesis protein
MNEINCSIFFHNYYGEHKAWFDYFSGIRGFSFNLFYNIVGNSLYNLEKESIPEDLPFRLFVRRSPNQGKDIGGKLVLLDAYLRLGIQSDYLLFLHDKKSPYKIQSDEWHKNLFGIVEPGFAKKALKQFAEDRSTGLITTAEAIKNEYDFTTGAFISRNDDLLQQWQSRLSVYPPDHRYAAGTMFWAREAPLLSFFRKTPPLEIRKELETGNVLDEHNGTHTHAWERLLSWLIFAQGYTIKGL